MQINFRSQNTNDKNKKQEFLVQVPSQAGAWDGGRVGNRDLGVGWKREIVSRDAPFRRPQSCYYSIRNER